MSIKTLKFQPKQFKGLYQGLDDNILNPAYSPDCQNFTVKDGILSTRGGIAKFISIPVAVEDETYGVGYAHKLMRLESVPSNITGLSMNGIPIIGVYFYNEGTPVYRWYAYHKVDASASAATWNLITTNETTPAMTDINPDYAHFIEYKIEDVPYLIVTGGGTPQKLHMDYGEDPDYDYFMLAADLTGSPEDAVYLALHRERVWMAGHLDAVDGLYIDGANTVTYCNAYDPTDWTTEGETGEIVIETFDGDYIRTIANALDDVLIFKRNTIHKVNGDTPEDYEIVAVYSVNGTIYGGSVCTDGSYCFFAASDGIYRYNGTTGEPLLTNAIRDAYAAMTYPKMVVNNNKLYIWDKQMIDEVTSYTGKCLVYDLISKTIDVIYTNDMYDVMVSDGTVLFTDGNYIYQLAG